MSSFIGTKPFQVPTNGDLGRLAFLDYVGIYDVGTYIPTIPSSTSISPTTPILFVSGTVAISTIVPPSSLVNGGQLTIIPTGKFSLTSNDNIAISCSADISKSIILTYESTTNKWYPSYANTVNRLSITAPANSATLTVADGKALTVNKTLTLDGADNKTLTVNKTLTLDGLDDKTLTVNASVTLNTTNNNAASVNFKSGGTVVFTSDAVTNLAGGSNNRIAYQTAVDTTGFISAPTTANTVLTYNGSTLVWAGSGLTPTAIKIGNGYTAAANDLVRCNTSSGAFTILLPASPLDGTIIAFVDVSNSFSANNLTISPNGNRIEGSTNSMISNVNGAYLEFTYIQSATNWKLLQAPLTVSSIVASGTPSGTTYLAGDGSWKTLSASSLTATGTKDATTYLAGDNTWKILSAASLSATGNANANTYLAGDNTWKYAKDMTYIINTSGSGSVSVNIDFSVIVSGTTTFVITLTSGATGCTITFTNLASVATYGSAFSFLVIVTHVDALSSSSSIVFKHGSNVNPKWTGGIIPPSTTTAGATDIWSFFTYESGSLIGSLAMADIRNT